MSFVIGLFIGAFIGAGGVLGLICLAHRSVQNRREYFTERGEPIGWGG
jgi:hypothetical protein